METQSIREVKRVERAEPTVFDRLRGRRRVDPLRATADGLGVVLDKLSESVTEVLPRRSEGFVGDGSEDGEIEAGRRTRGFKLRYAQEDATEIEEDSAPVQAAEAAAEAVVENTRGGAAEEAAVEDISREVAEVMDILKKARDVAADAMAPPVVMRGHERVAAQERLKELFLELGMKRAEIISAVFNSPEEAAGVADIFSLATPENAKAAYHGIDWMITKYLNAGKDETKGGPGSVYEGHEAAISATEQLKDFLRTESPEKVFTRFREVNRSNILGLLQ
jgi:hypothetical protein